MSVWPSPQSKIRATPMPGVVGGGLGRAPQITACAPQARVNVCTSTRGPANFCPKTGHQKRFFSMKQEDRSSERNQVAKDFAMTTFFYLFGLRLQI